MIASTQCSCRSGRSRSGRDFRKAPASRKFCAPEALAEQHVVEAGGQPVEAGGVGIGGLHARRLPREDHVEVVLQVLADALQRVAPASTPAAVSASGSPMPESCRICGDCTAPAQSSTSASAWTWLGLAALDELDADGAAVLDQDAGGARADLQRQVRPLAEDRAQVGGRRAPALAVLDGQLIGAEALLLEAVEVAGAADSRPATPASMKAP